MGKHLKDKKINLYKSVRVAKDKEGFGTRRWEPIHPGSLWAYTRQLSAREFYEAAAQQFQEERLFVVNWHRDIVPGMVVRYRDNWYEITRIDPLEDYKADVKLYVKEAVGGNRPRDEELQPYE